MSVGSLIRARRKELKFTLEEAATRAGMKASNLSDIESGKRDIRTHTLGRIAEALRCNPADLYERVYESDEEVTTGLSELIVDEKTMKLMSVTDREITWMRSIRFRPEQKPTKQDYLDLLFLYRNIE